MGFRVKKSRAFGDRTGAVPDVQAKRIKWKELKLAIEHWRLVFLDGSGVNNRDDTAGTDEPWGKRACMAAHR